jgi:small-conductance mechanosensitive channel
VNSKLSQPWLQLERIESLVQLEPALVIVGLAVAAWVFYKLFLRKLSDERHRNLSKLFRNVFFHLCIGTALFAAYYALLLVGNYGERDTLARLNSYVGLLTLLSGATIFVKTWRIIVFEYLFIGHMRVGVPLLLVNLFTLLLSVTIGGWMVTELFGLKIAPLLATSAIASLVLGLALQDTLGNLFSGVALQFDKPYEIGDWIEIHNGAQKWTGQVLEISWRATVLIGFTEETITVPNRVMAQAQISNFATKNRPIIRSQSFRFALDSPIDRVKKSLLDAVRTQPGIRRDPEPVVLLMETDESWVVAKLIYFIDNFGAQYSIGDQVIGACLASVQAAGLKLAPARLAVLQE